MPNGKLADNPLSDLAFHGRHPFPPDLEGLLLKIDTIGRAQGRWPLGENWPFSPREFEWERGEGLEEARTLLNNLLHKLEGGRGDEILVDAVTRKPIAHSRLKRGFSSSYVMATLMLLGTSISYLFITVMRRGGSTFAPLSPGVSASRIVLLSLSLIVIPLVPAILISTRDSFHFGVSGMIRWIIVGVLIGVTSGMLSETLPSGEENSPLILGLAIFAFRIIIGLAVILSSYWLVFKLPTVASDTFGKRKG